MTARPTHSEAVARAAAAPNTHNIGDTILITNNQAHTIIAPDQATAGDLILLNGRWVKMKTVAHHDGRLAIVFWLGGKVNIPAHRATICTKA